MKNFLKNLIFVILGIAFMSLQSCRNDDSLIEKQNNSLELAEKRYEAYPYKNISQDEASHLRSLARNTKDTYDVVSNKKIDLGDFKSIHSLQIKDENGNKSFVYYAYNLKDNTSAVGIQEESKVKLLLEDDGIGGVRIIGSSKVK